MRVIFDSKEKVSVYCDRRYSKWAQRGISGREHQLLTSLLEEIDGQICLQKEMFFRVAP